MEWKQKTTSGVEQRVEIENNEKEVEAAYQRVYLKAQKKINLPGFRPGKAPLMQVKKHLADTVQKEVADELISENLKEIFATIKPPPINYPRAEVKNLAEKGKALFVVHYENWPDITLTPLENLQIHENELVIDEQSIDELLEHYRKQKAVMNKRSDDNKNSEIQLGDYLQISLKIYKESGTANSQPSVKNLISGQDKFFLELGKTSVLPGFDKHLIGMRPNEEKRFSLVIAADYFDQRYSGKTLDIHCRILEADYPVLPKINDQLAHQLDSMSQTVKQWRDRLGKQLREHGQYRLRSQSIQKIIDSLRDQTEFEVPPSLITRAMRVNLKIIFERLKVNRTITEENFGESCQYLAKILGKNLEDIQKDLTIGAEKTVRQEIIMYELEKKLNIKVSENEVVSAWQENQKYLQQEKKIKEESQQKIAHQENQENQELGEEEKNHWQRQLLSQKLLDVLYKKVQIIKAKKMTYHEFMQSLK